MFGVPLILVSNLTHMKTILTLVFLAFITLTTSAVSTQVPVTKSVESVSSFKFFRIHRQGNGVALSWEPTSTQVQHFLVERSYDGDYFEPVTNMACNGAGTHKFIDEGVYPGYIHYRVVAVNADNSTETSPVQMIRIVQRK